MTSRGNNSLTRRATTRSTAVRAPSIGARMIRNSSTSGKSSRMATKVLMANTKITQLKVLRRRVPVSYTIKKNRSNLRKMSRKRWNKFQKLPCISLMILSQRSCKHRNQSKKSLKKLQVQSNHQLGEVRGETQCNPKSLIQERLLSSWISQSQQLKSMTKIKPRKLKAWVHREVIRMKKQKSIL